MTMDRKQAVELSQHYITALCLLVEAAEKIERSKAFKRGDVYPAKRRSELLASHAALFAQWDAHQKAHGIGGY
jgi:hypothetical protein